MQGRFVFTIVALILLVTVISFCNLFVLISFFVNSTSINWQNTTAVEVLVAALKGLWPRLLLLLVVNIVIVSIVSIMYSHQFAGPAFNLNRVLREVAKGNLSVRVFLRKNDNLQGIASEINQSLANLQGALSGIKTRSDHIAAALRDHPSKDAGTQALVEEVKKLNNESLEELARFQLEALESADLNDEQPTTEPPPG